MADAEKPTAGKDVAEPGKTPADATSKPVIIGHGPQVADPMVSSSPKPLTEDKPAEPATPAPMSSTGSSRPKLTPSTEAQAAQAAADKAEDVAEVEDDSEAKAEEEHQARLQELIETGEYRVSIGQKNTKSSISTFFITVIVIIVIGVVALFILTDLKIIDLGVKLPFHIFKQ